MTQREYDGILLDRAQDKIVLLDSEGRFRYANAAVERLLGWSPEELVGECAFDLVHPDDADRVRDAFERTIVSDSFTETTVEYRFRGAEGGWVWLESRMSNLTDEELDGYIVSSRDIEDRVRAEREREATARQVEEIAATTGDVLWMFSGDWSELLFVNPAYETVYGGSVEALEADPSSFLDTVHPDDLPAVREAMERLSDGEPIDMEYRVNTEEHYDIWVWVQGQPIVEDGEVVRVTGFARDITDRRRRERQLRVMDNLLRHNLRNDLNVITANAQLIEAEAPELSERTAVIRRTGRELLETAEKQRDLIRYLTGELKRRRLDVVELVDAAVGVVRASPEAADITADGPERADATVLPEVEFAVTELLENAVRHSEQPTPSVAVTVEADDAWVWVTVEDDAPPMPAFEVNVLEDDHEMSDIYHSTGLGLWLVYWLVELSDGTIEVETGEDGNRIRLWLPREEREGRPVAAQTESGSGRSVDSGSGSGPSESPPGYSSASNSPSRSS